MACSYTETALLATQNYGSKRAIIIQFVAMLTKNHTIANSESLVAAVDETVGGLTK